MPLRNTINTTQPKTLKPTLAKLQFTQISLIVHLRTQLAFVRIAISDNGPGMSEQVRSKLFDPFFTTKPIGSGTGLGLSISYQIMVEKHRGSLRCVSAPGAGAEFIIEIPVKQPL